MAFFGSITINNYNCGPALPPPPPMSCCGMRGPIFGMGFCRPMGCWPVSPAYMLGATAGSLAGAAIAFPQLGKALAWPFVQLGKGAKWVWNEAIKPAATWVWNSAIKPAAKWVWGGIKKAWNAITGLFKKKKKTKES